MTRPDVVIIGGGFAGAATAFFLARRPGLRVLLLEQESEVGRHSSGRSAGLIRRASGDPALDPWCDEGAAFLADPPPDFPGPTSFRRTGSFLLLKPETARAWARGATRVVALEEVVRAIPPLVPDPALVGLFTPDDGVVEPKVVLEGFIAGATARGVEVRRGARVEELLVAAGRVSGVRVNGRPIPCRVVVDAAGAWAGPLAARAGAGDGGLQPTRRHLLQTAPDARVDPRWPWLWDVVNGFYFRPAEGGLLACACDETADEPRDCIADPAAATTIGAQIRRYLPELASHTALDRGTHLWAGHRTLRPDHRFLVGVEPRLPGFVWAAGVGGHGVTCAAAVGRLAAEAAVGAG